jgi:hypothetical protein
MAINDFQLHVKFGNRTFYAIHATRTDEHTLSRNEPYSRRPKHIAAVRPDSSRSQISPAFQQQKYAYYDGPKARIVNVVGGFLHQDPVTLFRHR